jgi:hypothetical protein
MLTSDGLLVLFRETTRDTEPEFLWADREVFTFIDLAYQRFVIDIGGIAETGGGISTIPLVSGTSQVTIHPAILRVRAAQIEGDRKPLKILHADARSPLVPDQPGRPRALILAPNPTEAWLLPPPDQDGELVLSVYRRPLERVDEFGRTLVDVEEWDRGAILDAMLAAAYAKQDSDGFDPQAAAQAEKRYQSDVYKKRAELARRNFAPGLIAYGGL